ncbi:MAG: leucine-rich repeat protein, partial [Prevotella sp.]
MINMGKFKVLLLTLFFMTVPIVLFAYAKNDIVTFDGNTYQVLSVSPTYHLMFVGTKNQGELQLPSTIDDKKGVTFTVTEVGFLNGYDSEKVTSVKLSNTVTKINANSFRRAQLTRLYISSSVKEIDEAAWNFVSHLPKCYVEESNTTYEADEKGALYTKGRRELLSVPSSIATDTHSDTYAVDSQVEKIRRAAFVNAKGLKKIELPLNLKEVGQKYPSITPTDDLEEFVMNGEGTHFKVIDGVLFGKNPDRLVAYPRNKKDKDYQVPAGINTIVSYALFNNPHMETLDLNNVAELQTGSLSKVNSLKKIKLSATFPKEGMKGGAIEDLKSLEEYEVDPLNPDFIAESGVLFSKDKSKLYYYPPAKKGDTYNIPSTVKEIGQRAFQGATQIVNMEIPATVEKVATEAFRNMTELQSVNFLEPSKIQELPDYTFRASKKLKEVILPSTLTKLDRAFYECEGLEKLVVPNESKLKEILPNAFFTNKKLKEFIFEGSCELTKVGAGAFASLTQLVGFKFPKSVKEIGKNAFNGCTNFATLEFDPDGVVDKIDEAAFADCGINNFIAPKNVVRVEREAFRRCLHLTQVMFGDGTEYISPEAFKYCEQLTDFHVSKDNTVYSSVDGYLLT